MDALVYVAVLTPILVGLFLAACPEKLFEEKRIVLLTLVGGVLLLTAVMTAGVALTASGERMVFFDLTKNLSLSFRVDSTGRLFSIVLSILWVTSGFYAFSYMKHSAHEKRMYGFYLIVYGVILALNFAGDLITFYMFYELMTLTSVPMVLHEQSKEATAAGFKYMFYSFFGAYMALFGLYFINRFGLTYAFTDGGVLNPELIGANKELLLLVCFFMIMGFSVKAGMFPLHAWLTSAHPVAPSPASAVLSGMIVKCGVLGIIRVVYQMFGAEFLRGTWVQFALLTLTLITVFMGSMAAYREKLFKKRLAYSTVSQISYILFGIFCLNETALTGSYLHISAHAFIKCGLFLCAGAIIHVTGHKNVDDYRGIGKKMPALMWCYTLLSLGLIGIPPMGGFTSKWFLGIGALRSASTIGAFSYIGPIVLLISALLTAGYLLPISLHAFFPGKEYYAEPSNLSKSKLSLWMLVPIIVLTLLAAFVGVFPGVWEVR